MCYSLLPHWRESCCIFMITGCINALPKLSYGIPTSPPSKLYVEQIYLYLSMSTLRQKPHYFCISGIQIFVFVLYSFNYEKSAQFLLAGVLWGISEAPSQGHWHLHWNLDSVLYKKTQFKSLTVNIRKRKSNIVCIG